MDWIHDSDERVKIALENSNEEEFYIFSKKYTEGPCRTWWKEGDSGYTINLSQAGIYSKAQILAKPFYYISDRARPVPKNLVKSGKLGTVGIYVAN